MLLSYFFYINNKEKKDMTDVRLKLSPPWIITIRKIEALFDGDPQIACNVDYSSSTPSIVLACNNGDKVAALQRILPDEYEFGNIKLKVEIDGIPSNRTFLNKKELFETAFEKNPAFSMAICPADDGYAWFAMTYVIFKNRVIQIPTDNINDAHGLINTLYQEIASDLLTGEGAQGVFFCTDVEVGHLGKPLGEWP